MVNDSKLSIICTINFVWTMKCDSIYMTTKWHGISKKIEIMSVNCVDWCVGRMVLQRQQSESKVPCESM